MTFRDQSPDPWERIGAELDRMRLRIAALERRGFVLPLLDADPANPTIGEAWLFNDGRLRIHNADGVTRTYHPGVFIPTVSSNPAQSTGNLMWLGSGSQNLHVRFADGSVGQFDNINAGGGGSSGDPDQSTDREPAPEQKKSHQHRAFWSANDTGSYCPAHGREGPLYFGTFSGSSHPERRVMYGFPANSISSTLAGSNIRKVEIRVGSLHAWYNGGVDVTWGTHNVSSLGGGFAQRHRGVFTRHWPKSGGAFWREVPRWIGEAFRDEKIAGLTIDQPSGSQAFYGQMAKGLDLRVTFTHKH